MALEALPVGVNAMYEKTMDRIEGREESDLAMRTLTWLVYARESLTMDGLRHALAVDVTTFTYDPDLLVDAEVLLSACCGLITFEPETELVRLVRTCFLWYTTKALMAIFFIQTTQHTISLTPTCPRRGLMLML